MDEIIKKIFIGIVPDEKNFYPFRIYLVNPTNESFFVIERRSVLAKKIKGEKTAKKSFELKVNNFYLLNNMAYIGRSDFTIWYYILLKTNLEDVYGFSFSIPGKMLEKKNRRMKKLPILDKKGLTTAVVIERIKDKGKLLIPPIYYCKNKDIEKFFKNEAHKDPMNCMKILKEIGGVSLEDFIKYSNLLQKGLPGIDKIDNPLLIEEIKNIVRKGLIKAQIKRGGNLSENYLEDEDNFKAIFEEFLYEEIKINESNKKIAMPENLEKLKVFQECKKRILNRLNEIKANKK